MYGVAGAESIVSLQLQLLLLIHKKRVIKCLNRTNALLWVLAQHFHHDVSAHFVQTRKQLIFEVDLALTVLPDNLPHFLPLEQRFLE